MIEKKIETVKPAPNRIFFSMGLYAYINTLLSISSVMTCGGATYAS